MITRRDPSVEELRRESEQSRAEFASAVAGLRDKVSDTADHLKHRLSPSHLKEEAKDYIREGSAEFFHSMQRRARDNPLRTVAIGAGLAYPLWGLLKAIPVPIMLVGAGLWLSRKSGPSDRGQDSSSKLTETGREGPSRVAASVRDAGAALSAGADTLTDKTRSAAHDLRDAMAGMTQTVADSVKDNVTTATDSLSDAASKFTDSVSDAASKLKDTAANLSEQSRNGLVDLVDRNPLLVAGVGLAIGAFIAASIPPSEAENRVLGERSDKLKDKGFAAAAQGVERAKGVATEMIGDVAAAAGREGLNPEGLNKAVAGLTEGVRSVVDRGLKTALGETKASLVPGGETTPQTNPVQSNKS